MKKTKHIVFAALAAFAVLAIFAACAPSFEPEFKENFSRQTELLSSRYFKVTAAAPNGLTVQLSSGSGNVPQLITLTTSAFTIADGNPDTTNKFNLVIRDGKVPGVTVYSLTNGADSNSAYMRGPTLSYTPVVSAPDKIDLLLKLNETVPINGMILLEVSAEDARFGVDGDLGKRLNMDEDQNIGEAAEDVYLVYFPVYSYVDPLDPSQNRLVVSLTGTGELAPYGNKLAVQTPSASLTDSVYIVNGTKVLITGFQGIVATANATSKLDMASIQSAYKFERFNLETKAWEAHTPTFTWDTAVSNSYDAILTFPRSGLFDFFRLQIDRYLIKESAAVLGYVHHADNDQSFGYGAQAAGVWEKGQYFYGTVANVVNYSGVDAIANMSLVSDDTIWTVTTGGEKGNYYVDVEIDNLTAGSINAGSTNLVGDSLAVSNKNIQVFYHEGTIGSSKVNKVDIKDENIVKGIHNTGSSLNDEYGFRAFRIKMPGNFEPVTGGKVQVYLCNVGVNYDVGTPGTSGPPVTAGTRKPVSIKIFDPTVADGYVKITPSGTSWL